RLRARVARRRRRARAPARASPGSRAPARGRAAIRRTTVDRRPGSALFQLLLDLRQEAAFVEGGQGVGELERGGVARLGVRLQGAPQRAFETLGKVGPQLPQLQRV